jgi:hypothetical protein
MKKIMLMLVAVMLNCFVGAIAAPFIGLTPLEGGAGLVVLSAAFGKVAPAGSLTAGLYTEAWTGFMVKAFRSSAESLGWYAKIKSYDQYAENDVIHFVNIGGDPTVLINNTSYPLAIETLADADKPIGLDKYQTQPTAITDDEVYAISYDKMSSVIERHRDAINDKKYAKAIHALAPSENKTLTPVIKTTGASVDAGTRKALTRSDVIAMKKKFDKMKVPVVGRILVLCTDHVNDLLEADQKFAQQYYNYESGKITNMYSFEIYEFGDNPYFNASTLKKIAFGESTSGYLQGSVAFYAPRMMKADGTTKTYLSEAATDPQNQQNLVNFRHYSICLPLKEEAIGAIISDVVATPTILTDDEIDFAAAGGTKNRTVDTNGLEWTIATANDWLTVSIASGKAKCVCAANAGAARTGKYTITLVDYPDIKKDVTVNQEAGA